MNGQLKRLCCRFKKDKYSQYYTAKEMEDMKLEADLLELRYISYRKLLLMKIVIYDTIKDSACS